MKTKLLIGIAASLAMITSVMADCTDPNDPACICTNNCGSITNDGGSLHLPPGSLQLWVSGSSITISNGSLDSDYIFESSTDLRTWTTNGDHFEVASDGTAVRAVSPGSDVTFYRLKDDTLVVTADTVSQVSTVPCDGTVHYIGYAPYRQALPAWGYAPYPTNTMTRYMAIDPSRTNTFIQYVGKFGNLDCAGDGRVTVTSISFSDIYRFGIYITNNLPANYSIRLKGFHQ